VVKLANLPDGIRGYETIELANVERYQRELTATHLGLAAVDSQVQGHRAWPAAGWSTWRDLVVVTVAGQ
jgi:hypothetical protein